MFANKKTSVDTVEYEEDEEEDEGYINIVTGDHKAVYEEGWRTPNSSWMDLEAEDKCQTYHVNVIVHEGDINRDCVPSMGTDSGMDGSLSSGSSNNTEICKRCNQSLDWDHVHAHHT
jgi:hypothetical protein